LRRGMMGNGCILPTDQEDLVNLKLQVCFIFKLLV
jgi:centromeric protein E